MMHDAELNVTSAAIVPESAMGQNGDVLHGGCSTVCLSAHSTNTVSHVELLNGHQTGRQMVPAQSLQHANSGSMESIQVGLLGLVSRAMHRATEALESGLPGLARDSDAKHQRCDSVEEFLTTVGAVTLPSRLAQLAEAHLHQ